MKLRIGIGYDIHKLVEGRPLVLGGVNVPFVKGLLGHSDGDALLHAVADALLGACALGDIGKHFPDTDPKYKDADSKGLLMQVGALIREHGFQPVNVDANVLAQRPKLAGQVESMRQNIAKILGIPNGAVSVKARTAEGMDSIGEGRSIAAQAVAMVKQG